MNSIFRFIVFKNPKYRQNVLVLRSNLSFFYFREMSNFLNYRSTSHEDKCHEFVKHEISHLDSVTVLSKVAAMLFGKKENFV